jgi:hypothetical protein
MKKLILTRDYSHQYLGVEGVEGSLHFPPLGDSHPSYWPGPREVLAKAYKVLEVNNIPFRGEVEIPDPLLADEVLDLIEDQDKRQREASAQDEDDLLEAELDRLGY